MMDLNIKLKYTSDQLFGVFIAVIWSRTVLLGFFQAFLSKIPIVGIALVRMVPVAIVVVIVLSWPKMREYIRSFDICYFMAIILIFLLSMLFYPNNQEYLYNNAYRILVITCTMYFVGVSLDISKHYDTLLICSKLSIILKLIQILLNSYDRSAVNLVGDMGAAYNLLPNVLFVLIALFHNVKLSNFIYSIIGSILLISFGSRGPILILVIFVIGYALFFKNYKYNLLTKLGLIALGFIIFVNIDSLFSSLDLISRYLGLSSRIFKMYASNSLFIGDGREILTSNAIDFVKDAPFFGYGLAGDRSLLGGYVHNIILEFILSFGLIIGVTLFAVLMISIIKYLIICDNSKARAFLWLLVCSGLIRLFFSGSFLTESDFFFMLGNIMFIKRCYGKKEKKNFIS